MRWVPKFKRGCAAVSCVLMTLNYHGKILYLTAELAEVSSNKLEVLTRRLFWLTLALVVLTGVLAVLTWFLVKHGH